MQCRRTRTMGVETKIALNRVVSVLFAAGLALAVQETTSGETGCPEGMVAYWKFDEGGGTTAIDSVGDDEAAICEATWTTGIVNGALYFDGSNDYVEVSDSANLSLSSEITIEAWMYAYSLGYRVREIACKYSHADNQRSYGLGIDDLGRMVFVVSSTGANYYILRSSIYPNSNEWIHVVATSDGDTMRIFFNGILDDNTRIAPTAIYDSPYPLYIGAYYPPYSDYRTFHGKIDEVAVYNRGLSEDEIREHYNNGLAGKGYCHTVMTVAVDIKPGSYPNSLNMDGHGVIPVAILGSDGFDVAEIDLSSLSFAGLAVRVKGQGQPQCSVEDVSGDFSGGPEGAPDGYPDLVCQFVDDPGNWSPGDGEATITGVLTDGTPFAGSDEISIVPPQ